MSVNFPTAFWKSQPAESEASAPVEDTLITWSKKLYYGYNLRETEFLNPVDFANGGLQITTTFPFIDYSVDGNDQPNGTNFYPEYDPGTIPSNTLGAAGSYFGWFLNETSNTVNYDPTSILSRYHRHDHGS